MILKRGNVERVTENAAAIEKLVADGFKTMDAAMGAADEAGKPEKKGTAEMTIPELKALAKEKGIEGAASLTKEELLAVLKDVV